MSSKAGWGELKYTGLQREGRLRLAEVKKAATSCFISLAYSPSHSRDPIVKYGKHADLMNQEPLKP